MLFRAAFSTWSIIACVACVTLGLGSIGCQSSAWRAATPLPPATLPAALGLSEPRIEQSVQAWVAPPAGWKAESLKSSDKHKHQVWLSPTGKTAYGVINFTLPFPLGVDLVLWAYMREMKKSEGEAILLSKEKDPELPGVRFVAEGGLYKTRTSLMVRGRQAWAVYAGTLRDEPVVDHELDLAERAREHTVIGLSQD